MARAAECAAHQMALLLLAAGDVRRAQLLYNLRLRLLCDTTASEPAGCQIVLWSATVLLPERNLAKIAASAVLLPSSSGENHFCILH